jgi:CRISPR/Cas system-associated exonuclease Cas4 (RecB family)
MASKHPFKKFGLNSLSPSQLSTFVQCPARWYAQKVLGHRSPSSPAMERGKAVETGIVERLKGAAPETALKLALHDYDRACAFLTGDVDAERVNIGAMIDNGYAALANYGTPEWPESGQHRVSIDIDFGDGPDDSIEIMGYVDLMFDHVIVDIKSTNRIPSSMSLAHRLQGAVYARTTNRPIHFIYVSKSRTQTLDDRDVAASQAQVRAIVRRMAAFLSLSDDKEVLRNAVPISLDGFAWHGEEDARRTLFGI